MRLRKSGSRRGIEGGERYAEAGDVLMNMFRKSRQRLHSQPRLLLKCRDAPISQRITVILLASRYVCVRVSLFVHFSKAGAQREFFGPHLPAFVHLRLDRSDGRSSSYSKRRARKAPVTAALTAQSRPKRSPVLPGARRAKTPGRLQQPIPLAICPARAVRRATTISWSRVRASHAGGSRVRRRSR